MWRMNLLQGIGATLILLCLAASTGAQSYVVQRSGTTESLRGVSAVSNQIIWASGTHGTYLTTRNGGRTWRTAQVPGAESLDFRDVQAFSSEIAYLMSAGLGDQSRIYKTEDGGKHWTLQFTNKEVKGFFDCMAFWDRDHGIVLGDPVSGKFAALATENGENWVPIPAAQLPAAVDGEAAFAASGTCVAVSGNSDVWFGTGGTVARVFHSADRGKSWSVENTPIVHGSSSAGIFSLAFRDLQHGIAVGGDYRQAEKTTASVAFTEDGGQTWSLSPVSPQPYFSAVSYAGSGPGFLAVGSAQSGYARDVRQGRWQKLWNLKLNAISVAKDGTAFGVGPDGTVIRFTLP